MEPEDRAMRHGAGVWLLALAAGPAAAQEAGMLPWRDAQAVQAGQALYAEHCAACHGADLAGEPDWRLPKPSGRLPAPPHDASGHTWHHPDETLFRITKYGTEAIVGGSYQSDMAGFGGVLSDDQILQVLAYIKSTWPRRVIETHDRMNAAAAAPPQ
jgi:mono/diheme cytochrome c family protein